MNLDSPDGRTVVEIDPARGGRLRSLRRDGVELLYRSPDGDPYLTGCYPMAPWAGRVRDARFAWNGHEIQLPIDAPPHAIHGVVHDVPWERGAGGLAVTMDQRWPFGGHASQSFSVTDAEVICRLTVTAAEVAMPVVLGYHPCFRRHLATGGSLDLDLDAGWMWQRDSAGIATTERVPVADGPWDDAFGGVTTPPRLSWEGGPTVEIRSSHDVWVVFDELADVVCVEPQTAPPDAFNRHVGWPPHELLAGETLTLEMRCRWVEPTSC